MAPLWCGHYYTTVVTCFSFISYAPCKVSYPQRQCFYSSYVYWSIGYTGNWLNKWRYQKSVSCQSRSTVRRTASGQVRQLQFVSAPRLHVQLIVVCERTLRRQQAAVVRMLVQQAGRAPSMVAESDSHTRHWTQTRQPCHSVAIPESQSTFSVISIYLTT